MKLPALGSGLVRTVAALYLVQAANHMIPLFTIPLLAARLTPRGWGEMAMAQSLGLYFGIAIEFGFNLSGARLVSRRREDPEALGAQVALILASQAALVAASLVAALAACAVLPAFGLPGWLALVAVFWTLPQAAGLQWLFQGLDRLPEYALLNFAARLAGLGGIALWVRDPHDAGLALVLQAGPGLILIGGAGWLRMRRLPLAVPAWRQVRAMLAESLPLGLYRILAVSQIAAVPFLLGVFAGPVPLGLFSGAERIVRATISLLDPLFLAIYPRLARGGTRGEGGETGRLGLTALAAMGGGGAALALLLHAAAPLLVSRLLGPGFAGALPVFEVLTLLVPLTGSALALGPLWTAAIGRDQDLAGVYAIATLAGLAVQVMLRPDALGTAWIAVGSQALLVVCFGVLLWRGSPRSARWTEVSSS